MGAKPSAFLIPLEPEPTRSSFRCFPDPACSCLLLLPWHSYFSEPCPHRLHSTLKIPPLPETATSAALSFCTPGRGIGILDLSFRGRPHNVGPVVRSVQPERPTVFAYCLPMTMSGLSVDWMTVKESTFFPCPYWRLFSGDIHCGMHQSCSCPEYSGRSDLTIL